MTKPTGYTLYLDHGGVATNRPSTDRLGTALTLQELIWMARGAAPFERAGRLWAREEATRRVLNMGDLGITRICDSCDRPVPACDAGETPETGGSDRQPTSGPCPGSVRRTRVRDAMKENEETLRAILQRLADSPESPEQSRREAKAMLQLLAEQERQRDG